jgi:hypothetical protein
MSGKLKELRCFCRYRPLLGKYGLNEQGKLFVHIKAHKNNQIIAEAVCEGTVIIRCRECFRWHKVVIRQGTTQLEETTDLPDDV